MYKELEGRLIRLAAQLLKTAAEEFSNHSCNDTDFETGFRGLFSMGELKEIEEDIARWNGDISEYIPGDLNSVNNDSILMKYLADTVLLHAADILDNI